MIKKSIFAEELAYGMQRELQPFTKKAGMQNLVKAAEHLHSALDILEESGLTVQADKVIKILQKIANDEQDAQGKPPKPKDPTKVSDRHTKGLTSEKMLNNLKNHGTVFNMADDAMANDLLDAEIDPEPLEVSELEGEKTFEDTD